MQNAVWFRVDGFEVAWGRKDPKHTQAVEALHFKNEEDRDTFAKGLQEAGAKNLS